MPCEIAYFVDKEKYNMTLFFINFYISLVIIITLLIFINTIYNYYVYNNILSEKIYDDTNVIENGNLPPKKNEVSSKNNILIGETVDYKLLISLLLDHNMYYNDKYFTLNITNILLDVFALATIVLIIFLIIYYCISHAPILANFLRLNLKILELKEYIYQYCYFINNKDCDNFNKIKIVLIGLILLILIIIYILRLGLSIISSINYTDYLNFEKSKDLNNEENPKNIENQLNIICDNETDLLKDNSFITKIINKLNGHNIHTVDIISATTYTDEDIKTLKKNSDEAEKSYNADKTNKEKEITYHNHKNTYDTAVNNNKDDVNKFIIKIKQISSKIKERNKDNKDNKDLDFVKLVLVYLNNKKIYNDNSGTPGQVIEAARTYSQSLLNIIINVIPYSNNLFDKFKNNNYDIENILIGAIPLSIRDEIKDYNNPCVYEYSDFDTFKKDHKEKKGCYYSNYLFQLKEKRTNLKTFLIVILILTIISIIAILVLFYYIYINYNVNNMKWAEITTIKMQRLSIYNPLKYLGKIMYMLNNMNR